MKIPYVNLAFQWEHEKDDLLDIFQNVMSSGHFVGGKDVELFEDSVKKYTGAKYCISLNSGTDALVTGLVALGVKRGDEVITPPNSFIASTAAIVHIGAIPVFADVQDDQNINIAEVRKKITKKTKAIMPVHLTGKIAQMDALQEISIEFDIPIIEDAAQSIGAKLNNKQSGTFAKVGCFSGHPLKNLNAAGDSGFLITDDENIDKKIRLMRNHGLVDRNIVTEFGYVSRMDSLQAAILNYRISHLDNEKKKRRLNATLYESLLGNGAITLPRESKKEFSVFHTYVIQVKNRDKIKNILLENGIETGIHYPIPIHLQPASKYLGYKEGDFPITEQQSKRILTLPIHQYLKTHEIEYICNILLNNL